MKKPDVMLWLSDARGIFIPRDFALSFKDRAKSVRGVHDEDWKVLEEGPEGEFGNCYWDVWSDVCQYATVTDDDGNEFSIHQDGDCWLIPKGWVWSDETEFFVEPTEPTDDEDQQ